MEEQESIPGLKIIRDLLPIGMLLISGLVWGMKLEARWDRTDAVLQSQQTQLAYIQAQLNKGILPLTEERIAAQERRLQILERDCVERGLKDGKN